MTKYSHIVIDGTDYYIPDWNFYGDEWIKIPELREQFAMLPHEQQERENLGKTFERMVWSIFGGFLVFGAGGPMAGGVFTIIQNLMFNRLYSHMENSWKGRTWYSRDGAWQYSRYPRDGFMKSKFPDKFGNPCYCRKTDVVISERYSFDFGEENLSGGIPENDMLILAYRHAENPKQEIEKKWLRPSLMGSCGLIQANNTFTPLWTSHEKPLCIIATPDIEIDGWRLTKCYDRYSWYLVNYSQLDDEENTLYARVVIPKYEDNKNNIVHLLYEQV